jgi:hypothetical protein
MKAFTFWDLVIILACGAGGIVSIPCLRSHRADTVIVMRDGRIAAEYPLDRDRVFTIDGALGPVQITIRDKAVAVTSASCSRHICVHTAPVRHADGQIVCVPNRLVVRIGTSAGKGACDAITR